MAKVMKKEFDPELATYGRFGPSTHLSEKKKHERHQAQLESTELVNAGAFAGTKEIPIPADVAKTFAEYYAKHF